MFLFFLIWILPFHNFHLHYTFRSNTNVSILWNNTVWIYIWKFRFDSVNVSVGMAIQRGIINSFCFWKFLLVSLNLSHLLTNRVHERSYRALYIGCLPRSPVRFAATRKKKNKITKLYTFAYFILSCIRSVDMNYTRARTFSPTYIIFHSLFPFTIPSSARRNTRNVKNTETYRYSRVKYSLHVSRPRCERTDWSNRSSGCFFNWIFRIDR